MKKGNIFYEHENKYVLISHFDELVKKELEKRKTETNNFNLTFADVYEDIANHTGATTGSIEKLRKMRNPSLSTALSIADYFEVEVTDIWQVVLNINYIDKRGICAVENCARSATAKGLCYRHFQRGRAK